jgi:hypothetical protein
MVATYTADKLKSKMLVRTVIHQPADAATAQLVDLGQPQGASQKCLPIALFQRVLVQVTASLLVGNGVTAFSIYAATDAAGSGGVAVVTHAVGTAPDAEGDSLNLECDVNQIREVLATATHVGVWLDCANNDDEAAVTIILAEPTYAYPGLTPDYTAA